MTKRSGRIGLLTDNEREYLLGNTTFDSKQKSKFLTSLLRRITACSEDLNLIWDRKNEDLAIGNWCSINFQRLFNVGQSINIRNTTQLIPASLGRVKYKPIPQKGRKKGVRYYWFDKSAGPTQYINKPLDPSIRFRGIKPKNVRDLIIKATKSDVLPENEKDALSIQQIKLRLKWN